MARLVISHVKISQTRQIAGDLAQELPRVERTSRRIGNRAGCGNAKTAESLSISNFNQIAERLNHEGIYDTSKERRKVNFSDARS